MPRALLAIGVAFCGTAFASAQTYTLTQINPPPGATSSSAVSVNNLGRVVGNTEVKAGRSNVPGPAFVWENGVSVSLPSLGLDNVNAISDSGLIVGYSSSSANGPRRAVWWQGGANGDWNGALPAGSRLVLHDTVAISQDSQFVVFDAENLDTGRWGALVAQVAGGGIITATWSIDTPAMPLFDSLASDISYNGTTATLRVVGFYANSANDYPHAFLWQKDSLGAVSRIDLDNVNRSSLAEGVNAAAEVAGNIDIAGTFQAYFWDASGLKQQLGTLGGTRSCARSINDAGYVTGWSQRSGKNTTAHAFLWRQATGMWDLNTLKAASDTSGIELTNAGKINNVGQILARGVRKGVGVDVLLKPVP